MIRKSFGTGVFLLVVLVVSIPTVYTFIHQQQAQTIGQTIVNVPYWYVNNNTSDEDATDDKGSHLNFTAQQYGPDSIYDTLTEAQGTDTKYESYEINDDAQSNLDNYHYAQVFRHSSAFYITKVELLMGGSGSQKVYLRETTGSPATPTPGDSNNLRTAVSDVPLSTAWVNFTFDEIYFIPANTEFAIVADRGSDGIYWRRDASFPQYLNGHYCYSSTDGTWGYRTERDHLFKIYGFKAYELDLEVQWTNVDYSETNEELCIYAFGSDPSNTTLIDSESFEGTWPPTGWTETGNWNKEGNQAYDGTYSADFDGGFFGESGDLSTLSLDCSDASAIYVDFWYEDDDLDINEFLLRYYDGSSWDTISDLGSSFQEDQWIHYQAKITDIQYFVTNFRVCWSGVSVDSGEHIYVDLITIKKEIAPENLRVDVWNGASWQNVFTDLTNGWNNVTVTSYLTAPQFTVRFKGTAETTDITQDTWDIDAALLHTWS